MKISLAMIAKNSAKHIGKTILSIGNYVDEIVVIDNGSTDNTVKICKQLGAKVIQIDPKKNPEYFIEFNGTWPNFTMLRRRSFDECKNDVIIWLDSDDIMEGVEYLPDTLEQMEKLGATAVVMNYHYEILEDGTVVKQHNKERIVDRRYWQWEVSPKWAVHENLYPKNNQEPKVIFDERIVVVHEKEQDEHSKSNNRNYNILQWMIKQDEFVKDARVYYLLAREALSLNKIDQALDLFNAYLQMEYAPHDALDACINCCEINEAIGDFQVALEYATKGIGIRSDHPLGYVYAARYLNYLDRPKDALDMLSLAEIKTISKLDNSVQQYYTMYLVALEVQVQAYERLKMYEKAIECIDLRFPKLSTDDKKAFAERKESLLKEIANNKIRDSFKMFLQMRLNELGAKNKKPELSDFDDIVSTVGGNAMMAPEYLELRRLIGAYRVHGENEITFVHTSNFEEWDPKTIWEKGGGGSETALVEMSLRLAKAGFKVSVYARPAKKHVFKGVLWDKFENINLADDFNIFFSLRDHSIFTHFKIHANKKYLWLQDIANPIDYTPELYNQLDKILVLSKYHRETAFNVPESKFYYTTNGINLRLIREVEKEVKKQGLKRIKDRCLYISSADRGLEKLLDMVPSIRKKVPNFSSSWYYGWNSTKGFGLTDRSKKLIETIDKKLKIADVEYGGRIGKKELYKHLFTAEYHTYPLIGPAETSCIAVMETQACGLIPITTGITALEETQQFGVKVPLAQYESVLTHTLQNNTIEGTEKYRKEMMQWARKKFNWDNIAKQWIKDLI